MVKKGKKKSGRGHLPFQIMPKRLIGNVRSCWTEDSGGNSAATIAQVCAPADLTGNVSAIP